MVLCVFIRCTTLISTNFNFLFVTFFSFHSLILNNPIILLLFNLQDPPAPEVGWEVGELWIYVPMKVESVVNDMSHSHVIVMLFSMLYVPHTILILLDMHIPGEEVCMKGVLIAYPEHAVDTTHRNPKTLEPPKWRRWKRRSPRNPRRDFITFCQVGKIECEVKKYANIRERDMYHIISTNRNANAAYFG